MAWQNCESMRKASIIRVKQVGIRVVSVCYYIM